MTPNPFDPSREAERLRIILEVMASAHPDMALSVALPMIREAEKTTAKLEFDAYPKIENVKITLPDDTPKTAAKFIDLQPEIQKHLPHAKINAIKELRRVTGLGLKEAKEAVEYWSSPAHVAPFPPPASPPPPPATPWSSALIADWIDGQTDIIDHLTGMAPVGLGVFSPGKIHAIKETRSRCPSAPGLREAKEGCEHWLSTRPLPKTP